MAAGNYDDEEDHPPLLQTSNHNLTGTVWTALAHFIAGVIGSGVLSLAWSVAQLGWIAGPLCVVVIARSCLRFLSVMFMFIQILAMAAPPETTHFCRLFTTF
ncbi:putative amino acid transporter, transmembrane domain-containing protein [Helianthus annuus]|nr:putative amino acid transporter, transmembrane domain-containing protein [Helianthus annuus]